MDKKIPLYDPAEVAANRRHYVLEAVTADGLLAGESSEVVAVLPKRLVALAKKRIRIKSTTDLLIYALAKVALEDDFGAKLVARRGTIPADFEIDI
jgi:hypothetical protein